MFMVLYVRYNLTFFFPGKVCSKFSKESPLPSQIIQKINMKCVEARRPQRVREQRPE